LLSFATQKESDCDTYKSLVGVLNKNLECFVEDGKNIQLSLKDEGVFQVEKSSIQMCSCCGAPLKLKSSISKFKNSGSFIQAPAASPRAHPFVTSKYEESCDLDSPQIMYAEKDSELPQNKDDNNLKNQNIKCECISKMNSVGRNMLAKVCVVS
jgi:hypothetical protein